MLVPLLFFLKNTCCAPQRFTQLSSDRRGNSGVLPPSLTCDSHAWFNGSETIAGPRVLELLKEEVERLNCGVELKQIPAGVKPSSSESCHRTRAGSAARLHLITHRIPPDTVTCQRHLSPGFAGGALFSPQLFKCVMLSSLVTPEIKMIWVVPSSKCYSSFGFDLHSHCCNGTESRAA